MTPALIRAAKRGEAIYGGTDVTKGGTTAKMLTYEGDITSAEVEIARELP